MTRRLSLLIVAIAVAVYDIVAFRTRKVPTITHIVHITRLHFKPHCEGCCCVATMGDKVRVRVERNSGAVDTYLVRRGRPLAPRRPAFRGWHTSVPS